MIITSVSGLRAKRRMGLVTARALAVAPIAAAMLIGLSLGSAQADATCTKPATVRIQEWTGDIINLVPWVADAEGMFRKHCLDVKFIPFVGGPASFAAMVSGSLNFGSGSPDVVMRSRAKGADFRLTSNMYAALWSALVANNKVVLPHLQEGYPAIMKDLAGKKIGVTALGGSTEAFMRESFEGAGMNGSSATYVAVGGVSTAVPALRQGIVDAAMMFGTGPDLAEAFGAGKIVLDYRKKGAGPDIMQSLWGASLSWAAYGPYIDKNQDVVAAFSTANNEAVAWIKDPKNRTKMYDLIGKRMPLPEGASEGGKTLKRIVDINADGVDAGIPPAAIEGWNKYLLSLKQIQSPIAYDELVWRTGRQ